MKKFSIVLLILLTSCTYSINMIHSSGTATDMIDENQRAEPEVQTYINAPAI